MGNVFALTLLPIPRLCLHATHDYLSNLKSATWLACVPARGGLPDAIKHDSRPLAHHLAGVSMDNILEMKSRLCKHSRCQGCTQNTPDMH